MATVGVDAGSESCKGSWEGSDYYSSDSDLLASSWALCGGDLRGVSYFGGTDRACWLVVLLDV